MGVLAYAECVTSGGVILVILAKLVIPAEAGIQLFDVVVALMVAL
jgi:hypothetical protein